MRSGGRPEGTLQGPDASQTRRSRSLRERIGSWFDRNAGNVFLLPTFLIVLLLSIFPFLVSAYLSLSRIRFVRGGFEITFVGLRNYRKLIKGSEKRHFLGVFGDFSLISWLILIVFVALLGYALWRYLRSGHRISAAGVIYRIITFSILSYGMWYLLKTLSSGGRPGTLAVTFIYVFLGIGCQYLLGLGLALLTTQRLVGRRFFRVVFLLPMMITPVGIAYTFRMLTDTDKGPINPIWKLLGLAEVSWVTSPWGARWAIMIGDIWQWTPFMFIVLLAAIEGLPEELFEAAHVDGASRWQIFWNITLPQLVPVSVTVVLIRMIEAFKIVDLPNVLTNGGPGTATESLTLHSFFTWRALDLGGSAAIAYMLLIVSLFVGISYANLLQQRAQR
ncbi:MAG: sugar ABC transporter permease [Trueperaceae bacterium]|nr:MAG: sugar ABC transporter permease [Trueperaceae bacterium]